MVSKVQAGHYGFRLAVVDRWLLFVGGHFDRFDCTVYYKLCYIFRQVSPTVFGSLEDKRGLK